MAFIVCSRSCPYRCTFCSIHQVFGTNYTHRSVESIIDEIVTRYSDGIRHFDFEDDNLGAHQQFFHELLDRLIALNLTITCSVMNGICYHTLTPPLLQKMKRVGFEEINISLVSINEQTRKASGRPTGGSSFEHVVTSAAEYSLHTVAYYIIGLPHQTLTDALDTLLHLASLPCLIGASPFYNTPGSSIYNENRSNHTLVAASQKHDPFFSARLTAMDIETEHMQRDDLYTIFRLSRVFNYIKECIDSNTVETAEYWHCAMAALTEGRFYTNPTCTGQQFPFSQKVHALLNNRTITVCGYKTTSTIQLS